jgi:hypothetical protein
MLEITTFGPLLVSNRVKARLNTGALDGGHSRRIEMIPGLLAIGGISASATHADKTLAWRHPLKAIVLVVSVDGSVL